MQSLVIEDPGKKDRRINLAMEDSASMTIEFLRARLLSERSVSRTARQRADQLAKRVMQLEEQLRVVITQRRKAEKAAAEVLEILENHGVNDFSEAFDSNSDEDGVVDVSKESDSSTKEEGNSLTSKLRRHDLEDGLSSSELEACRTPGRSLSWKSGSHSSHEKNFADGRRHRTFLSTGRSYPKHRLGKSCRQIKRRETREAAESARDASQDGVSAGRDDISINFLGRPENGVSPNQEEKASSYDPCSSVDQREENGSGLHGTDHRDREMEIALEQQAQLIGRYEAEENAQREWEEKYQEDNGCTLDLREPGTQSDITEERTPPKTQSAELAGVLPSSEEEAKPKADEVQGSKESVTTTFNGLVASHETYYQSSIHKLPSTMLEKGSRESEPTGQVYSGDQEAKEKQKQAWSVDNHNSTDVLSNSKLNAVSHGPESSEVGMGGSCVSPFKEQLTSQKPKQAGNPSQTTANGLSGVLEALQLAKLSLHQELTVLPSSSHHVTPDTRSLTWKNSSDLMEIPVGCTSLFRLPSELQRSSSQGDLWRNPSYSDLGLSISRHRSEAGLGISADNRNLSYTLDNDPAVSAKMYPGRSYGDPYLDSAAMEIRPPYRNTSFNVLARLPSPSHYHRSDQVRMPPTSPYYYSAQMPPLAPYHYPNSKTGLNDRQ